MFTLEIWKEAIQIISHAQRCGKSNQSKCCHIQRLMRRRWWIIHIIEEYDKDTQD